MLKFDLFDERLDLSLPCFDRFLLSNTFATDLLFDKSGGTPPLRLLMTLCCDSLWASAGTRNSISGFLFDVLSILLDLGPPLLDKAAV